jgi:DNA polymerase elongation subunit (family B)
MNRLSREVLIKTKDTVQSSGFELLYADTDSVFLKKDGDKLHTTPPSKVFWIDTRHEVGD